MCMNEKRVCLDCQKEIVGRADKKFCDDNCRNNANNKRNSESNQGIKKINAILKRNRQILSELVPNDTGKSNYKSLLAKGFNFSHFTHIYTNKKGAVYYFVYEFGYLPVEGEHYFLVRRLAN